MKKPELPMDVSETLKGYLDELNSLKKEYEDFKKNNPEERVNLSPEKLTELQEIETRFNQRFNTIKNEGNVYIKNLIKVLQSLLFEEEAVGEKKPMAPPFTSPMDDKIFEWLSLVQRFVYRCIDKFGVENPHRAKRTEDRKKLMDVWFDKLFHNSNLGSVRLTYDETLWPPSDVEYGSVFQLAIQPTKQYLFYIFRVDLNKKYYECIQLVNDKGCFPVNIFSTEFFPATYE